MKVQMLALDPAQVPEQYRADDEDAAIAAADVLIHATDSSGNPFDELCRDPSQFSGQVLLELRYRRCQSAFLQQADARHKIDGWDFFSEQARCQAKLLHRIDVSQEQSRQLTSHCRREWGLQHDPCASQH
jgi:shikimate 5-dehydrogenase